MSHLSTANRGISQANTGQSAQTHRQQKILAAAALRPNALEKLPWRILNALFNAMTHGLPKARQRCKQSECSHWFGHFDAGSMV